MNMLERLLSTTSELASLAHAPAGETRLLSPSAPSEDTMTHRALPPTLLAFSIKQEETVDPSVYLTVPSIDGSEGTLKTIECDEGADYSRLTPSVSATISNGINRMHYAEFWRDTRLMTETVRVADSRRVRRDVASRA